MKDKYKIAMCVFYLLVGSIAAVILTNLVNCAFMHIPINLTANPIVWIGGVFANAQSGKLFGIFMMLVLLLCVMYFFCSQKPYEANLLTITPKIKIPAPCGQAQHGSASFMTEEQKRQKFKELVLSPITPSVKKLLEEGDRRAIAVDNGQVYIPNVLNLETLFDEAGIVVGKRDFGGKEYIVCLTDDVHTLTIGATGGGKSRREVLQTICMLALAGEGIVVSDPKGELYHYTHTFLESIGYTVHVIDFNQPYKSDRYNPLQRIIDDVNNDDLTNASEHAWDIVNILVEKNEKSEPIWSNGEMAVIVASILAVVYDNRNRPQFQNLTNVYEFISNMSKPAPGEKEIRYTKYLRTLSDSHPARQTMAIAQVAPDKMGASFYTQALTTLRLFANPNTYRITSASDFDMTCFGTEPKHALFFILPDERRTFYPIVTILVVQQYEQLVVAAKQSGNRLKYRVNYVLDEFGNFSKINEFETKLTVARGYGIRWNLFLQSFSQLTLVYGKEIADIAKGNCRYWLYLQTNDMETNKEISEMLGKYTTSTYSLGSSMQKYSTPSSSANISLSERSLLTPDEIRSFERPYALLISPDPPAVMKSPDISEWLFNRMLGLGSKQHNTDLIMQDEDNRPTFTGKVQIKLWKPWERLEERPPSGIRAAHTAPKEPEFMLPQKGKEENP